MVNLDELHESLTVEQQEELLDHRGGCYCFYDPPCSACSEPLTMDEALDLGFVDDEPQPEANAVLNNINQWGI